MSSKGLGKPLTTELIFTKTKSDSLHNIKNLNLWGNDLEDLSLIQKMPNLQVVSLSVNRISTLKYFSTCQKLQELYLRKNNIADIREIKYLVKLPVLKVLWLHDNPCAQIENYREVVIKCLPNLVKLDNNPVTPEEKSNSQKINFSLGGVSEEKYKSEASHHQSYSSQYKHSQPQEQPRQRPMTGHSYQSNSSQKQPHNKSDLSYQEQKPMPQPNQQKWSKRDMQRKSKPDYSNDYVAAEQNMNRNQNILMAVLSLMRQLDPGSLQIIKRQSQKMLE